MKNRIHNLLKSTYREEKKRRMEMIKNKSLNQRISKSSNKNKERGNRSKNKQKEAKRREEVQSRE